jgi:hypothetical protein
MGKTKFDLLFEEIATNLHPVEDFEEDDGKTCQICKQEISSDDTAFSFNAGTTDLEDISTICYDCTQKLALDKKDIINSGDAEITEKGSRFELWTTCDSCEGLNPESEIKVTDAGNLCEWCIESDISRGEKIRINYNESPIG